MTPSATAAVVRRVERSLPAPVLAVFSRASTVARRIHRSVPPGTVPAIAWAGAAATGGLVVAALVSTGAWYLALGLVLAIPGLVLVLRQPLATMAIWLLVTPFVSVTDVPAVRQVFWLVHRGMPLAVLLTLALGRLSGADPRRLARLGWPDALVGGSVAAGFLSIVATSPTPVDTAYLFYERVAIPACLYLIVRLLHPGERELRSLFPLVVAVLVSQSIVGILSWVAPGTLPSMWLTHVGERTTGTFGDPDVFGAVLLLGGLVVLHGGLASARRPAEVIVPALTFAWVVLMAFLTFSRGNWLAALVVGIGAVYVHRRHARTILGLSAAVLLALIVTGALSAQLEFAQQRLTSERAEESALVRLPVAVAGIRMFEERPILGWGYDTFDLYSRPFQTRVGDLISAEKPHASHNLFLTILAEQGLVGAVLFLGPMAVWLVRSAMTSRSMIASERRLVASLWLGVSAFVIVNNFSVMKSPFGLGVWWSTIGLIGSLVAHVRPSDAPARARSAA